MKLNYATVLKSSVCLCLVLDLSIVDLLAFRDGASQQQSEWRQGDGNSKDGGEACVSGLGVPVGKIAGGGWPIFQVSLQV